MTTAGAMFCSASAEAARVRPSNRFDPFRPSKTDRVRNAARVSVSRRRRGSGLIRERSFRERDSSSGWSRLNCSNEENDTQAPTSVVKTFTLPSDSAKEDLKFGLVGEGRIQYVVVTQVMPDSPCAEAGVKVGQKVLEVSDPVRYTEMWELKENASLRFVRDAVRYRSANTIDLVLQDDGDLVKEGEKLTIGEKMEREWAKTASQREDLTAAQRRIKRRKEYMQTSSGRDNTPFFTIVFGLFVLPPAAILIIAYSTGYLDKLAFGFR
ncbi:hypothetical protein BSKO_12363 [Bryopsis sp. KO-2023]|nr:hypothetical protein BSKO_12363 [Bryopsis sp. KO-2023]